MSDINLSGLGINGITLLGSMAIAWGINKKTNEIQDANIENNKKLIGKLFDWKDSHEKEAAQERLSLHTKIASLDGEMSARAKENAEILKRLEHIDRTLSTTLLEVREDIAELKAKTK